MSAPGIPRTGEPLTVARRRAPGPRLLWLLPAGFALLSGLGAGLMLLGVAPAFGFERLEVVHGMLLVLGFVATLVSLERATALDRWYGFAAPALLASGAVLLVVAPVPLVVGKSLLVAGMAAFTALGIPLWRRQFDHPLLTQILATGLGLVAAVLWLGGAPLVVALPWLIGFLVLTIAAERVELARITMGPTAGARLLAHAVLIVGALLLGFAFPNAGAIVLGLALISLTVWLVVHDIARRTIRGTGVTRFMAACILCGYVWLFLAALLLLLGQPLDQPVYDAVVHAVFLGYTFSMIMAHATTILPAVLRIALPYRPVLWVPVAILQIALVIRIWFGDGLGNLVSWRIGGVLGVVAILLFALTAVSSAIAGPPRTQRPAPRIRELSSQPNGPLLKRPARPPQTAHHIDRSAE
ncbi:hypothetical protein NHL51_13060 [Leucobacter sp. gxy201]|uniref:hypothetical protein n=1 Tax=Leucobacter sp. gxy201 TaxID=2957200 RepID=UPI003DA0B395